MSGCINTTSDYQYSSSDTSIEQDKKLLFNKQGVSSELDRRVSYDYLDYSMEKIDCSNTKNYNKSQLGYEFYIESKWIPSTKEGNFQGGMDIISNRGCTNLYLNYKLYLVFNSEVIKKIDFGCYPNNEPLRPTNGYIGTNNWLMMKEDWIVNQTGTYFVQIELIDCKTNETLTKKAVMVDMGNINEKYYNRVVSAIPIDIS